MNEAERAMREILALAEQLLPHLDSLSVADREGLYGSLDQSAKTVSRQPELLSDLQIRVRLCDYRDQVLDAFIDDVDTANFGHPQMVAAPRHNSFDYWGNEFLLKDTGVGPYMLARTLDARSVLFFADERQDYLYERQLPGVELVRFSPTNHSDLRNAYFRFVIENARLIDVLALHGSYPSSAEILHLYRQVRPDGKVYSTLDMNTGWQSGLLWGDPAVQQHFDDHDVIANSCRLMRDSVNGDPEAHVSSFWITNGFYSESGWPAEVRAADKTRTILSVGRIGAEQKNHEELLLGFAAASHKLPGWNLRLVGPVDARIEPFLAEIFRAFPHLKQRVTLTGPVWDKAELYREYAQASVFALTSLVEGGTPNVYAEALVHGCMFVTSTIDAADDITHDGELGKAYTLGDDVGLTRALVSVCRSAESPKNLEEHITKASAYARRYFDWERNAKKIAYALYH